jgi:HIV Tat-specific factor 1
MIAEEIDSGESRIKMYEDEKGAFKGDALIVYFRPESVELAIQMLDDTEFRLGSPGPNGNMRVQIADSSYKRQKEAPVQKNNKDKQKIMKKTQKMNSRLADWDDDDPQQLPETSSKFDKVVILKHMFTPKELEVGHVGVCCCRSTDVLPGRSICHS